MLDQMLAKCDPLSLISLALAVTALAAVAVGWTRGRSDRRHSRQLLRDAMSEADAANRASQYGTSAIAQAQQDLRAAEAEAARHRAEMRTATELMREAVNGITVLTDELNEQNEELRAAREQADHETAEEKLADIESDADESPVGQVGQFPAAFATWKSDGDDHYAQANLWPTGGGVDLSLAVNGAAVAVCLDWQSLDVLVSLANELRPQDPSAPPVGGMVRADFMHPFGDERDDAPDGGDASRHSAEWAETVKG